MECFSYSLRRLESRDLGLRDELPAILVQQLPDLRLPLLRDDRMRGKADSSSVKAEPSPIVCRCRSMVKQQCQNVRMPIICGVVVWLPSGLISPHDGCAVLEEKGYYGEMSPHCCQTQWGIFLWSGFVCQVQRATSLKEILNCCCMAVARSDPESPVTLGVSSLQRGSLVTKQIEDIHRSTSGCDVDGSLLIDLCLCLDVRATDEK